MSSLFRPFCTLLKKKIKDSLASVDDLSIRFSYQGEVTLQDSEETLEKITAVHNRILKAVSSTKNEGRKRALILFAENLARSFYGFEPDFFQQNVSRIVDDVVKSNSCLIGDMAGVDRNLLFPQDKREFP